MPLPNIVNGTAKRCRARTKGRNLAPCLNLAAFNTPVCKVHGAVHPDKRPKGKSHGKYKHGQDVVAVAGKRTELAAVLRSLEDMLFLVGSLKGQQHTRGNLPAGYEKIHNLEQAQAYIHKLEAKRA